MSKKLGGLDQMNNWHWSEVYLSEKTRYKIHTLDSTANLTHLPKNDLDWPNWRCYLAGNYKTAPRILIF